jgi:glycine cleavage system aminomethyltransferase T
MSALRVTVLQPAARLGLKGPDAAALLQQAGISVPAVANRMLLSAPPAGLGACPVRVLRLGNTEFLLEQDEGDAVIGAVRTLARTAGLRAHAVLRADCCLLLEGNELFDRLSRVCAFDFTQLAAQPDMAVMTLLAEISVTFALDGSQLRLWADPGFATYLTHTLQSLTSAPSHGVHA